MPYDVELKAALEAAELASAAILRHYADFVAIPDAPANIATDADRQSQEIIIAHLLERFPSDAFCAEETSASGAKVAGTGPRLWIVDPIDGTRGFAMKNGEFSVMIGFVENGRIAVGVVGEPAHDRLTYAVLGGGCWKRDGKETKPTACKVGSQSNLSAATLVQSRSRHPGASKYAKAMGTPKVIETYSAGIKLAIVARGEADVYVNDYKNFHDWDIAAGQILVTEAGGKVTGLLGEELQYGLPGAWQRYGLLGTNGAIHEAALQRTTAI